MVVGGDGGHRKEMRSEEAQAPQKKVERYCLSFLNHHQVTPDELYTVYF